MSRQLLLTVRDTPSGNTAAYAHLWARLQEAVLQAGGRAWRFHSPDGATRHCEFVEWHQTGNTPPISADPEIHRRLRDLDTIGPATTRTTWKESPS